MSGNETRAMIGSFGRILAAALLAGLLTAWEASDQNAVSWDSSRWKVFGFAAIAAAVATLGNYLRPGETRFGVGHKPDDDG